MTDNPFSFSDGNDSTMEVPRDELEKELAKAKQALSVRADESKKESDPLERLKNLVSKYKKDNDGKTEPLPSNPNLNNPPSSPNLNNPPSSPNLNNPPSSPNLNPPNTLSLNSSNNPPPPATNQPLGGPKELKGLKTSFPPFDYRSKTEDPNTK